MSAHNQFEITLKGSDSLVVKSFVSGEDYFLDYSSLESRRYGPLPSRWDDLLNIASTIYFADLAIRRTSKHRRGMWRRTIELSMPIDDVVFWQSDSINSLLSELVTFLTGDDWLITLTCSGEQRRSPQLPLDFPILDVAFPCLYSGGLDSAAGLASRLRSAPDARFSPITVGHRSDICSQVADQLTSLSSLYGSRLHPINIAFENRLRSRGLKTEPSQRSRSLLFLAVGGVVSAIDGTNSLEVYESGIGSINAPLLAGMRDSHSTRGMHPKTMQLMSKILSSVFEKPFMVEAPFAGSTKGEVVRSLAGNSSHIAASTISCVHYPIRHIAGAGHRQCGVCPACLFRRVALMSAEVEEPGDAYQYNLLDPSCAIPEKKRQTLIAFLIRLTQSQQLVNVYQSQLLHISERLV